MNLSIDIGNTFTKAAIFDNKKIVNFQERLDFQEVADLCKTYSLNKIMICDVANKSDELIALLPKNINIQKLSHKTPLPIANLYETPETLGMDRLAAVVGAYSLNPNQNCIVIDAGSCITYDFISAKGEYLGGSISLGLQMRFKALHEFTAKLPLLQPSSNLKIEYIGKTTEQAIQSGVINGLLHEMNNIIDHHEFLNGTSNIFICGGDAEFFAQRIDRVQIVIQTLLLQGLNELIA